VAPARGWCQRACPSSLAILCALTLPCLLSRRAVRSRSIACGDSNRTNTRAGASRAARHRSRDRSRPQDGARKVPGRRAPPEPEDREERGAKTSGRTPTNVSSTPLDGAALALDAEHLQKKCKQTVFNVNHSNEGISKNDKGTGGSTANLWFLFCLLRQSGAWSCKRRTACTRCDVSEHAARGVVCLRYSGCRAPPQVCTHSVLSA